MSGPLLFYPGKPNGLPDDIESFVHLFYYFILRYHNHSMSPRGSKHSTQELGTFLSLYFFRDERTMDGQYFGGNHKFSVFAMDKKPPFALIGHDGLPLQKLLDSLHSLCCAHYRSLDIPALEQYAHSEYKQVPKIRDPSSQAPRSARDLGIVKDNNISLGDDPFGIYNTIHPSDAPVIPQLPPDPFADHNNMYMALKMIVELPGWMKDDKVPDQFVDIPSHGPIHDKKNSHSFFSQSSQ